MNRPKKHILDSNRIYFAKLFTNPTPQNTVHRSDPMFAILAKKCREHGFPNLVDMLHSEEGYFANIHGNSSKPSHPSVLYSLIAYISKYKVSVDVGWGPTICDTWIYMFGRKLKTNATLPVLLGDNRAPYVFSYRYEVSGVPPWRQGKLIKPYQEHEQMKVFYKQITRSIKRKIRFVVFPISVTYLGMGHAGSLVIDNVKRSIEQFDPQGNLMGFYMLDSFGKELHQELVTNVPRLRDYTFYSVRDLVGKFGPQSSEGVFGYPIFYGRTVDRLGYCEIWSILYAILRVTTPDAKNVIEFMKSFTIQEKKEIMYRITGYFSRRAQFHKHCEVV